MASQNNGGHSYVDVLDPDVGPDQDLLQDEPEPEPVRIPPPPEASYPTYQKLKDSVQEWTRNHGFDLVVNSSQKGGRVKIVVCGRYGKTRNSRKITDEHRVRKTSSHKSGCRMQLKYVQDQAGNWSVQHSERSEIHNHAPLQPHQGTANQRRYERDQAMRNAIKAHFECGITIKQSLDIIKKQFPGSIQTSKDEANIRAQFRRETLKSTNMTDPALLHRGQAPTAVMAPQNAANMHFGYWPGQA